jgi:hypothetical protein
VSRLIDEALHVACTGYLMDPEDRMRGAMVALMSAGMLVAPGTAVPAPRRAAVTLVRLQPRRRALPWGGVR